jgi:hypothetical protein
LFILWFWKERSKFSYEVTIWCFILFVCHSQVFEEVCCSVVHVHDLRLPLPVSVNSIIKLIYTPCKCKCIKFIYIHVSVDVEYEMCKCKNKFIYISLQCPIIQSKCKKYIFISFYMAL